MTGLPSLSAKRFSTLAMTVGGKKSSVWVFEPARRSASFMTGESSRKDELATSARISAALSGLGKCCGRSTQGVTRRLALPWAIICRAFSPSARVHFARDRLNQRPSAVQKSVRLFGVVRGFQLKGDRRDALSYVFELCA